MQLFKSKTLILIGLIVITYTSLYTGELLDDRPFKFEKYRTEAEFENGLKEKFPLGSNAEDALRVLRQSGAECRLYDDRDKPEEKDKYLISCKYNSGLFSLHPLENYRLYIYGDIGLKIIKHWVERTTGIII